MKKLNVTCTCMATYSSFLMVPDEMDINEAIAYAKDHLAGIPLTELDYVPDSDILNEDSCGFDEYNG